MVALYDSDGVVGLYRDDFDLYTHRTRVLGEFLAGELFSGICNDLIGRAQVGIDLALLEGIPGMCCTNILEPLAGLITSAFVDDVEDGLS